MKTSELLALPFLLFAFTTLSLPGAGAETQNAPVLDTAGRTVTTEHVYYIIVTNYLNCNFCQVILANESNGIPPRVILSPNFDDTQQVAISQAPTNDDKVISVATNLNFRFNFSYDDWSTKWNVSQNTSDQQWFVTIGGYDYYDDWFQIREYNETTAYQLLYRPKPQPNCNSNNVVVGLVVEDGVSYLSPNKDLESFPIEFLMADDVAPA